MEIAFITSNAEKAAQIKRHIDRPIRHRSLDLQEIQSLDLAEIVEHKAISAFGQVGSPVLVEDTSLCFHALGRLPGPLIKWFLEELDNEGLAALLRQYADRRATARVLFGLYDGNDLHTFAAAFEGTIAESPRGNRGFGWDPIFIPADYEMTWGEMDMEMQDKTSMRKIALLKLNAFLQKVAP